MLLRCAEKIAHHQPTLGLWVEIDTWLRKGGLDHVCAACCFPSHGVINTVLGAAAGFCERATCLTKR